MSLTFKKGAQMGRFVELVAEKRIINLDQIVLINTDTDGKGGGIITFAVSTSITGESKELTQYVSADSMTLIRAGAMTKS